MRAFVCESANALPTGLTELPSPKAGKGEVVMKTKAVALNFPDVLMIQGKYHAQPTFPFVPGLEAAGLIKEVGEGVTEYKVGDAVCAHMRNGALAEEIRIEIDYDISPVPFGVSFEQAVAIPVAYGTSLHALKDRGQLRAGETLLVLGASGGVGISAVQIGKLLGAKVIAAASTDDKLQLARNYGADHLINYEAQNLREVLRELTGGEGVNVVLDPVGDKYAEPALRSMAWHGRYLVVGFAAGQIPKMPLNLTIMKCCSIIGVALNRNAKRFPVAYRQNLQQLYDWVASGQMEPVISAQFPLEKSADAYAHVIGRKAQGKIVVTM